MDRILELPAEQGELISKAVLSVTTDPEEYDLWYNDAPIWLVHRRRQEGQYTRVSRVQVTPCALEDRRVLLVQPDVHYLAESGKGNGKRSRKEPVVRSLNLSTSTARAEKMDLEKLFGDHSSAHRAWATHTIADMIRKVWSDAERIEGSALEPARGHRKTA